MDIEIFPHRLLSVDTTEKLLNSLDGTDGIKRMVIQGPRLSSEREGNPDHRIITVNNEEIDIQVKAGRILIEIESEETIEYIREICEGELPFGFNIHIGRFIRDGKTVSDTLKYGEELKEIPEEMVGLTDQNAQLSERAKILRKKEE